MDITPRERGIQALALLRAGLLGRGDGGPVGRDPATVQTFFDLLARNVRGEEIAPGSTIQWDFPDHEPWYLLIEGPRASAPSRGGSPSRPCACACAGTTSASSSPSAPSPTTS